MLVTRPVWRSFTNDSLENAANFVRSGGHAVIRETRVLMPPGDDGMLDELTAWALLEMRVTSLRTRRVAPLAGLLEVAIPKTERARVMAWCQRDESEPGATATLDLDCRTCGACCRSPRVLIQDIDLVRWRGANRSDLSSRRFVIDDEGEPILRLRENGRCQHLDAKNDTECTIYELRPENCRAFPAGGNGCLTKRALAGLVIRGEHRG